MESANSDESRIHVWIARLGVFGIAVVAFLFVYDAGVAFAAAVGYRPELTRLWPWLIEGFLALVVYTGGLIRQRGGSVAYPACLFSALLGVSGYMNVRVHTHHGPAPLALNAWEAGSASALPVLILASSVHLLLRTFERPKTVKASLEMPDALTVGKLQEQWAEVEPAPVDVVQAVTEPGAFTREELAQLPPQPGPALRGMSNFQRLYDAAVSPAAKQHYQEQIDKLKGTAPFMAQAVLF